MAPTVTIVFGGLIVLYIFLRGLLFFTQDAREPPAILTEIPFFGPLVGMVREKSGFHLRLRFVGPAHQTFHRYSYRLPLDD